MAVQSHDRKVPNISSPCGWDLSGAVMWRLPGWCLIPMWCRCQRVSSWFTNHLFLLVTESIKSQRVTALQPSPTCVFWGGEKQRSWMNEWVGPDINVVGPLQLPPSDEFSISESSHFYGKFEWLETAHRKTKPFQEHTAIIWTSTSTETGKTNWEDAFNRLSGCST